MIFQNKPFIGHAGQELPWKVECDGLTDDDWKWAAARVAERLTFDTVVGIATGGLAFESALEKYKTHDSENYLICDDVLTTGTSMEEYRRFLKSNMSLGPIIGVVLFARAKPPSWIHAIWRLW